MLVHVADRDEWWKFSSGLTLFDDPIRVPNINEPGCICLIPFDTTLKYVLTYNRLGNRATLGPLCKFIEYCRIVELLLYEFVQRPQRSLFAQPNI